MYLLTLDNGEMENKGCLGPIVHRKKNQVELKFN